MAAGRPAGEKPSLGAWKPNSSSTCSQLCISAAHVAVRSSVIEILRRRSACCLIHGGSSLESVDAGITSSGAWFNTAFAMPPRGNVSVGDGVEWSSKLVFCKSSCCDSGSSCKVLGRAGAVEGVVESERASESHGGSSGSDPTSDSVTASEFSHLISISGRAFNRCISFSLAAPARALTFLTTNPQASGRKRSVGFATGVGLGRFLPARLRSRRVSPVVDEVPRGELTSGVAIEELLDDVIEELSALVVARLDAAIAETFLAAGIADFATAGVVTDDCLTILSTEVDAISSRLSSSCMVSDRSRFSGSCEPDD